MHKNGSKANYLAGLVAAAAGIAFSSVWYDPFVFDVVDLKGALQLGAWLWIGFPSTLLGGSVIWEGVPSSVAALHAGDWLLKLLIMNFIIGLWAKEKFD